MVEFQEAAKELASLDLAAGCANSIRCLAGEISRVRGEDDERVKRVVGWLLRCNRRVLAEYWRRGSESVVLSFETGTKMPIFPKESS